MVCQNQSIDDSDAPLARDLRILVRERLQAGDSDAQVLNFLVARYGEFVLLRPRFNAHTAVLWLMPVIVLLIGGAALVFAWRRYRRQSASWIGGGRQCGAVARGSRPAIAHPAGRRTRKSFVNIAN